MKSIKLILIALIGLLLSCTKSIDLDQYINEEESFKLTVLKNSQSSEQFTEELEINTMKWKKLIEWLNENKEGWKSTPASYLGDKFITQKNIQITILNEESVVINLLNENRNQGQYIKKVNKNDLNFLGLQNNQIKYELPINYK